MTRKTLAIWLAVAAVSMAFAPAALATQPVEVSTTTYLQIHPPDFTTGSGTFDPFVSAEGMEIPGGTFEDSAFAAGATVHVTRTLYPEGGGSIDVRFSGRIQTGKSNWAVVSGTGPYTNLHGRGTLQVVSFIPGESPNVVESWTGLIHFDP